MEVPWPGPGPKVENLMQNREPESPGSRYQARRVDADGRILYSEEDHQVWRELNQRQRPAIQGRACHAFEEGLSWLQLPEDRVPQLADLSDRLKQSTGWTVEPVPALIPFERFFEMLSRRSFPAASFVRDRSELDYLQEPDMFHECFGHLPLLTNHWFADFTQWYGELGLRSDPLTRSYLGRLYWFTAEFGLLAETQGLRIYGGGILSSIGETVHALESLDVHRQPFDLLTVMRTPYRIDIMQPIYFVLGELRQLESLIRTNLDTVIDQACALGDLPARFTGPAFSEPKVVCGARRALQMTQAESR